MGKQLIKNILIGVVVLVLIVLGILFWRRQKNALPAPESVAEKPAELGAQIFDQAQNPTKDKFPEANPFGAETNPFSAYTNPFKDAYKNPFSK